VAENKISEHYEPKVELDTEQAEAYKVDAHKNNGLAQLAIGGLVGAVMVTVAIVLTDKKTANALNRTAKNVGNAVKGATEGVNNTIKNKAETVKNKATGLRNDAVKDANKTAENEIEIENQVKEDVINSQIEEQPNDVKVFQLYEERLIANKRQVKTGEVAIAKHTETHVAQVSISLAKERLVLEQIPVDNEESVASSEADFNEGELTRIELYEQTAEIEKKAFVREQIRVSKQVEYKALEVEEQIRREELDLDIQDENEPDSVVTTDEDKISDRFATQIEQDLSFN